jgi:hypothetical protein
VTFSNPIEWFEQHFCDKCVVKTCTKKGTGLYSTSADFHGRLYCATAALIMLDMNRPALKQIGKKNGRK